MAAIESEIERICGSAPVEIRRFPGGDISGASAVRLADDRKVVLKRGPVVAVESRMLRAMAATGVPVPDVLGTEGDVLLIEHCANDDRLSADGWEVFGRLLGRLHAPAGPSYGWDEDYALRDVTVENARSADWAAFWAEHRLACHLPHIETALARRVEELAGRLSELLPSAPHPALLHGDLWGGNILVSEGKVSGLIDPCAYHGDREVDFATLTVFDNPPESFFAAADLEPGWRDRQPIYRLWMWLVHLRLFGPGYRAAVDGELKSLGF